MSTRKIVYTGLFAALGIILPQAFHMIGGPTIGQIFLPIHLPVLIGAMLLGPMSGVLIALVSIIVGVLLGMPPMPIAIFMLVELVVYGLVAGYLYNVKRVNVYIALIGAMILGRLVELGAIILALRLFEVKLPPVFGTIAMFATSIPGIIIQVILVPALILVLERAVGKNGRISID
ncbi:MAG: ECF transporter S component [Vallitaleaceae bacterium]|jgi:riboflavin transporter FmnP|nr:ECF transporter S component [Vallitaleaceae bacterium]